ncbi:MAG: response regulator transcription factor [Anaerolineaceae bacterium]|nr:MAG: response regulator transcription factor [Anaerolineaceae bacterium]
MYQLMIIDDEPIVRAGIKNLLPWSNYNFEVCAEGVDGKDGLKKVLEYSPDLVLVDVKMPGMNGIELIREAKKQGFEGKFIILTGYSDFEFAKSAVSLGVRAYLLKPIDEEELCENVEEVLAELEAKKNLDDYYSLSELKARQVVLRRLLQPFEDKESIRREIKLYGMDFKYNNFCVAILSQKTEDSGQEITVNSEKKELIQKGIANVDSIVVDNNLVLICKDINYINVREQLLKNNERMKREYNDSFFISIGHDVANWEDINFSYECAKLLTDYKFLYKELEAVSIDDLKTVYMEGKGNFAEPICELIDIGDKDSIEETLRNLKSFYKSKVMNETEIKVQVIQNIVLLFGMLEKKYLDKVAEFPDFDMAIDNIKKSDSLDEMMKFVNMFSIEVADKIGITTTDNIVKRVLAYMERNYVQDLKLEDIAKIFSYNSAYLGKVFKKIAGDSFNSELNRIRIDNAKRLLLETDLKVYQISEQVGYSNTDYFYTKFRKYVGLSPKDFIEQNKV